ncbi:MAG: sulfate adenylyltransferase [Lentisphaerae bacterium GWF2_44_16]|nr:MAG: sulfate adenylyltransferase [Lentisphaerae bacterium GWF2_44_16]
MSSLEINIDAYLEIVNIAHEVFAPLKGFMGEKDYHTVVDNMRLASGKVWPIPVTLDIPENKIREIENSAEVDLFLNSEKIGSIMPESIFEVRPIEDAARIFKTSDLKHPGVAKELARSKYRTGGRIKLFKELLPDLPEWNLTPAETRKFFSSRGWKKIASFQTRNPPHLAHEYLQRIAMEVSDGIFLQPLIGWKKKGDFTPEAIMGAYNIMVRKFYPDNALLGTLRTSMRYAGPREAVFHAIIRRNYGCTSFIVGRDHAGVGDYYGKYEAQQLAVSFEKDLGIEILPLAGPRYCSGCKCISTEKTCAHAKKFIQEISGTKMRRMLSSGIRPDEKFMRREISDFLIGLAASNSLFCA